MKTSTKIILGIVALLAVAALLLDPKLVVTLPKDGAGAKQNTFKGTYGHCYTEMFLIGGDHVAHLLMRKPVSKR